MDALECAFYGDDFTGATDTLATWGEAGFSTLLFLGVPTARQLVDAGPLEVLGIAGAARAMGPEAMRAELQPVARFFSTLVTPVLHYKCCSTFDSAPRTGNLAVALEVLQEAATSSFLPIVGGQPSLGRYCAFGQLFASAGSGGDVHRIDRHPTMSRHPVTPMHEADLRRHLAAQGLSGIDLVDWRCLEAEEGVAARGITLFDVLASPHLATIGRILRERSHDARVLALGASSVAQALIAAGEARAARTRGIAPADGPVFVVAGSQSPVTAAQVECAAGRYQVLPLQAATTIHDADALSALAADCAARLAKGQSVLVQAEALRDGDAATADVARACGRLLAEVVERSPGLRRVGVAGGDTSSLSMQALSPWALGFAGRVADGVTLVRARAASSRIDGLEIMLKGGQMGTPDLFLALLDGSR